jgi:hypothetical protein
MHRLTFDPGQRRVLLLVFHIVSLIFLSVCTNVYLSVFLNVCLSVSLFVCLSVCLPCLSEWPSVHLYVCLHMKNTSSSLVHVS